MNEKMIYGVVGLILGAVIMNVFGWNGCGYYNDDANYGRMSQGGMMHRMQDGSMMSNDNDMGGMMRSMMSGISGKTGDDFDKAFLSEMIIHHEGAVEMAKEVLAKSKRPELIKLANDIISAQTTEINMMKNWQTTWFK